MIAFILGALVGAILTALSAYRKHGKIIAKEREKARLATLRLAGGAFLTLYTELRAYNEPEQVNNLAASQPTAPQRAAYRIGYRAALTRALGLVRDSHRAMLDLSEQEKEAA